MTPDEFLVAFNERHGQGFAERGANLDLEAAENGIIIEGLMVPLPRRRGFGSEIMAALCRCADQAGMTLLVRPEPVTLLVENPIQQDALDGFYARFGFRPVPGSPGLWQREPRAAAG